MDPVPTKSSLVGERLGNIKQFFNQELLKFAAKVFGPLCGFLLNLFSPFFVPPVGLLVDLLLSICRHSLLGMLELDGVELLRRQPVEPIYLIALVDALPQAQCFGGWNPSIRCATEAVLPP